MEKFVKPKHDLYYRYHANMLGAPRLMIHLKPKQTWKYVGASNGIFVVRRKGVTIYLLQYAFDRLFQEIE